MTERFEGTRVDFPILETCTYLNSASKGPLRREVAEAAQGYYADYLIGGPETRPKQCSAKVELVRSLFADFVGADVDEIAFTKNITEGINIIAHGLGLGPGDNVVFVAALEHPTIVYALAHLRLLGVELRCPEAPQGDYDLALIAAAVDHGTKIVCVSTTSFITGARPDLREISDLCHAHGAILLVDGAQGLGILDLNVHRDGIDALAGSAHKGLLGMHGVGFLYCRRELAERITPTYLGRNGVSLPDGAHYFTMGQLDRYELAPAARRFDLGHQNYPAIFGLQPCLEFLISFGPAAVERRVLDTTGYLIERLTDVGIRVITPHEAGRRGGTVSIECGDPGAVYQHLASANVVTALRRGVVRFGLHLYSNRQDVDTLLSVLAELPPVTLIGRAGAGV